jgi:hypothetical protein
LIITDNGANMVKAVKIMNEKAKLFEQQNEQRSLAEANDTGNSSEDESDDDSYADESENETSSDNEGSELMDDEAMSADVESDDMTDEHEDAKDAYYTRMKCMAHTLQLVIKKAYNHYDSVIIKARRLVSHIRRSGPSVEKLRVLTGKFLVTDNATRWNSTFMMIKRLLEVKVSVNDVLQDMHIDSLLVAEWSRLEELASLLEPFASQTDILQSDSMSLPYVVLSLLELQYHLQSSPCPKSLTKAMLDDIRSRFDFILNHQISLPHQLPVVYYIITC